MAVQALGIGKGDEVIMPTFTIISCAMAVSKLGGIPVFVDSKLDTWNMDVNEIEARITSKTKTIMVVHLYGLLVEVDKIIELAQKYDLKIIEDAAEMHGQTYNGKMCGSFGDISTFSFYPNKHITTGEGGMIVTDDDELAERCKMIRNLCFRKDVRYVHDEISDNYRFTNLQAAVGLAQLERLDEFVEKKRKMGIFYTSELEDIESIQLPIRETEYAKNIYWVYGILLEKGVKVDNREIQKLLAAEGIGSRTFFWCMHEQPVYNNVGKYMGESYPNAEYLARKGFYIPSGLALTEMQMEEVVSKVRKILKKL